MSALENLRRISRDPNLKGFPRPASKGKKLICIANIINVPL
jgi:hypothetical protein